MGGVVASGLPEQATPAEQSGAWFVHANCIKLIKTAAAPVIM